MSKSANVDSDGSIGLPFATHGATHNFNVREEPVKAPVKPVIGPHTKAAQEVKPGGRCIGTEGSIGSAYHSSGFGYREE